MKYWLAMCLMCLSSCQVLDTTDEIATLQAGNQAILAEATTIAMANAADRERIQGTADASMTEVARIRAENETLLATVRAAEGPSQGVIVDTGAIPTLQAGQRWFAKTGTSTAVDDAGCVINPVIRFSTNDRAIYATMKVYNIESGVQLTAVWSHEGIEAHRESYPVNRNWSEVCLWFSMDQSQVVFSPGNWAVQLFADGAKLESPMSFIIQDDGA